MGGGVRARVGLVCVGLAGSCERNLVRNVDSVQRFREL